MENVLNQETLKGFKNIEHPIYPYKINPQFQSNGK